MHHCAVLQVNLSLECTLRIEGARPLTRNDLSIDLVRAAARSESFPRDWTEAQVERAADNYARFLGLARSHPHIAIAPTRDIDLMWHLHMLHPVAYADDCKRLLGCILDHDGGFGGTAEELPLLQEAFAQTAAAWLAEYGEAYVGTCGETTKCVRDCQGRCWHACKSSA